MWLLERFQVLSKIIRLIAETTGLRQMGAFGG
jgi:hypothetical protein